MNIGFKMRQSKFNNFPTLLPLTTFGGALIEESLRNGLKNLEHRLLLNNAADKRL